MLIDNLQILEGAGTVNLSFPKGTSFPSSPNAGEVFYRTDEKLAYVYSGTAWVVLGAGSSGSTVTLNDLLPSQTGNAGKVLSTTGSSAQWVADTDPTLADLLPSQTGNAGKVLSTNGSSVAWVSEPTPPTLSELLPSQTGNAGKVLSTNGSSATWVSEPAQIYDIGFTYPGEVLPSSTLLYFVASRQFTVPSSFSNSAGHVGTVTADVVFSMRKNGSEFGTVSVSSSGTVILSASSDTVFNVQDVFSIESPAGTMPTNLALTISVVLG